MKSVTLSIALVSLLVGLCRGTATVFSNAPAFFVHAAAPVSINFQDTTDYSVTSYALPSIVACNGYPTTSVQDQNKGVGSFVALFFSTNQPVVALGGYIFSSVTTQGDCSSTVPGAVTVLVYTSGPNSPYTYNYQTTNEKSYFGVVITDSPGEYITEIEAMYSGASQDTVFLNFYYSTSLTAASLSEDPHFVGIQGEKYEIVGEPGKWFNIISDPYLQYNSLFSAACENKPWMTAISSVALKIHSHRFMMNNTGSPTLDGVPLGLADWHSPHLIGPKGIYGWIAHPWVNYVFIGMPDFHIKFDRHMVNPSIQKPGMVYYGKDCLVGYFNTEMKLWNTSANPHGLIGQTAHHKHAGDHIIQSKASEGQGEIEGTYKDYMVSGPWEDDFKFNKYIL